MRRLLLSTAVIIASAGYVVSHDLAADRPSQRLVASATAPQQVAAAAPSVGDSPPALPSDDDDGGRFAFGGSLLLPTRHEDSDDDEHGPFTAPVMADATAAAAQAAAAAAAAAPVTPTPRPETAATTAPATAANPVTVAAAGQYADGTYTGPSVYAVYGQVQVQIVVNGGRVTAVNVLDYPAHTRRSQQISDAVLPRLKSQVIQNQDARVSFISGATLTVRAFASSLASALGAARS